MTLPDQAPPRKARPKRLWRGLVIPWLLMLILALGVSMFPAGAHADTVSDEAAFVALRIPSM